MPDESQSRALSSSDAACLVRPLGIKASALMSDNGSCYRSHFFRSRKNLFQGSSDKICGIGQTRMIDEIVSARDILRLRGGIAQLVERVVRKDFCGFVIR